MLRRLLQGRLLCGPVVTFVAPSATNVMIEDVGAHLYNVRRAGCDICV